MKALIVTSSNEKYGDFICRHWLKSLKSNLVAPHDVAVLDYGLKNKHRIYLKNHEVSLMGCKPGAHINVSRFFDLGTFLKEKNYDVVILTDGGDIIFQSDFSDVFDVGIRGFGAVAENYCIDFTKLFLKGNFYDMEKIKEVLHNKKMINCGFLIGNPRSFIDLSNDMKKRIKNVDVFGVDQIAVNYFLYTSGFKLLPQQYNYVFASSGQEFYVKNGKFYNNKGLIPIVHNAGRYTFFRVIDNFGYGRNFNKLKKNRYNIIRTIYKLFHFFGI